MAGNAPIDLPDDSRMAHEPALTIGQIFANKAMIKTYVAAIVSLVSMSTTWVISDDQIGNIVEIISLIGIVVTAFMAQYEAKQRAQEQARQTRAVVYAPATVAKIADQQYAAGVPPTGPQPPIPGPS